MTLKLQAGGTLNPRQHLYITRQDQEEEVYQFLVQGEYCNILAPRQIGKSSLMMKTVGRLQEHGLRTVTIDVSGIGSSGNAEEWYTGLLRHIARGLRLGLDVNEWWTTKTTGTPNERLLQFFREIVFVEDDTPVVIFLDEIDSTLRLPYSDDLFTAMRTMYNERSVESAYAKITFCLIGVATPNELIKEKRTTPYNIGKTIELRDFEGASDDLTPLIRALSDNPATGKAMLDAVLKWTDGQPYLTMLMCEKICQRQMNSPEEVEKFINEAFGSLEIVKSDPHFEWIDRFLNTRVSDQLTAFKLYESILSGKHERDEATSTHIHLKLSGLIKRNQAGNLIVRNPIYERIFNLDWVHKSKPQKMLRSLKQVAVIAAGLLFVLVSWWVVDQVYMKPPREAAKRWLVALDETSEEVRAQEAFEILTGQRNDPDLQRRIKGFEQLAVGAYKRFWERRSEKLLTLALKRLEEGRIAEEKIREWDYSDNSSSKNISLGIDENNKSMIAYIPKASGDLIKTDESLLLGILSALKRGSKLPVQFIAVYDSHAYARLRRIFRANIFWRYCTVTPDETRLTMGGITDPLGEIWFWEISSGKVIQRLRGHKAFVQAVDFAPDGKHLLSGSLDKTVKIWDLESDQEPRALSQHTYKIEGVNYTMDGRPVITGLNDNSVLIWDAESGKELLRLKHRGNGWKFGFSPDRTLVATTLNDNTVSIWDAASGDELLTLQHEKLGQYVAFSPDGQRIITTEDKSANLWDVSSGKLLITLEHNTWVQGAVVSQDGQHIATGDADGYVKFWDVTSGRELLRISAHINFCFPISFLQNGTQLLTSSAFDDTARLWDVTLPETQPDPWQGTPEEIWQRWQDRLQLTVNDDDEVVPLWPTGPRKLKGWDPKLMEKYGK